MPALFALAVLALAPFVLLPGRSPRGTPGPAQGPE